MAAIDPDPDDRDAHLDRPRRQALVRALEWIAGTAAEQGRTDVVDECRDRVAKNMKKLTGP